ncbi:cysteine hydrolase family protein [Exiguobacterium qingdaonense]|uniref:cysteine hydrolase family protein n=1 Tax=Exiguobacterium qingdaonense TaxID=2751251 RepID=UPI001BE96BFD|nr:isochorismatase family cysteine hydrolase [Exiguobacterium qingdaonense]
MRALIVIDYTFDFIADSGRLTCGKPGQEIEERIVELIGTFSTEDYVVIANDVHDAGDTFHPETTLFPPHNIRGTEGRELYGAVKEASKQADHWIDKTRYSAFSGTDLDLRLRERGITEIHLVGVCTDICVLHTAVDAYNLGYQIVVHADAVQSFNSVGHEWALEHFVTTLGATVVGK